MTWLFVPGGGGFSFAAANNETYHTRVNRPGKADRRHFSLAFTETNQSCDPKSLPGRDLSSVFAQNAVNRCADDFVACTLKSHSPFARLDLTTSATMSLGGFHNGRFVTEQSLAARTVRIIVSLPSLGFTALSVPALNGSGIAIREAREFQLWQGNFVLLPTDPPSIGLIQAYTHRIPVSVEYQSSSDPTQILFPNIEVMDKLTEYAPTLASHLLDSGKIVRM